MSMVRGRSLDRGVTIPVVYIRVDDLTMMMMECGLLVNH